MATVWGWLLCHRVVTEMHCLSQSQIQLQADAQMQGGNTVILLIIDANLQRMVFQGHTI